MKKIVVLSLAAAASFGLAACSKQEPVTNETEMVNEVDANMTADEAVTDVNAALDANAVDANAVDTNAAAENTTEATNAM